MKIASPATPPLPEIGSIRNLFDLALAGDHVDHDDDRRSKRTRQQRPELQAAQNDGLATNRFGLVVRTGSDLHFAPTVFYDHARHFPRTVEMPDAVQLNRMRNHLGREAMSMAEGITRMFQYPLLPQIVMAG